MGSGPEEVEGLFGERVVMVAGFFFWMGEGIEEAYQR